MGKFRYSIYINNNIQDIHCRMCINEISRLNILIEKNLTHNAKMLKIAVLETYSFPDTGKNFWPLASSLNAFAD